ncbi:GDP-mannose pyrophosphatase NudK [Massilia sp. IC2-476]|uniref:GDP-mannose pyrophosphatase NudK n=1 Tax=Massilia sp. IC2-476 TaxID=2887199 RepID=UPI001D11AD82|nr:GDP-mannose pyrophosphatase NudK [Massilia sp. IC2-476]MCC2972672.1 GDP-mannose pyrophosphatase NudK [Massilia sp. IC2-476]
MSAPVELIDVAVLSDQWYVLKKYTFDYLRADGSSQRQVREVYDRGNGAAILLYNRARRSVVLTRQFRLPAYLNGLADGMLIEAAAGLLDDMAPAERIRMEAEEETGYRIERVEKVFEAYMSPGSVTEKLHFFVAEYEDSQRVSDGGGVVVEGEDIQVLELPFDEAVEMIGRGEIVDGKTIMLLQHAALRLFGTQDRA